MLNIAALLLAASATQVPADRIFRDGFEPFDPNCQALPLTRMNTSNIRYLVGTGSMVRYGFDITEYESIWGHASNSDNPVSWPGRSGTQPALLQFWKAGFLAAKFHVPIDVDPRLFLVLGYGSYFSGPTLDMAVSSTCGDFNPPNANCLTQNVGGGTPFKRIVMEPYVNGCPLVAGQDYYINIRLSNPTPQSCAGKGYCEIATNLTVGLQ